MEGQDGILVRKIIGAYASQQNIIRYPLDVVAETWGLFDTMYWFGGNRKDCLALEEMKKGHIFEDRIVVVNLHHVITEPIRISEAQTKVVAHMRANDDADIIAFQEADEVLTPRGEELLAEMTGTPQWHERSIFAFSAIKGQMFIELTYPNPQSLCVMEGDVEYLAKGDGWENYFRVPGGDFEGFPPHPHPKGDLGNWLMIDLGYFGTEAYLRKMRGHNNVWPYDHEKVYMLDLFQKSKERGIAYAVERTWRLCGGKRNPVVPYEGAYRKFIDRMGLYEDYCQVKEIVERMLS